MLFGKQDSTVNATGVLGHWKRQSPKQSALPRVQRPTGKLLYHGVRSAIFALMSITATVENDTIKLPAGVHLPDGTEVRVDLVEQERPSLAERYADLIGIAEDLPPDLARNLDHYLHGHPKQP